MHCRSHPAIFKHPAGPNPLGTTPGEVLYADTVYVNEHGYILVICDSLTRKTHLKYCKYTDSDSYVEEWLEWRAAFNLHKDFLIVTDRGSHFANAVAEQLTFNLRGRHGFAISYASWLNGGAEVSNKRILKLTNSNTHQ